MPDSVATMAAKGSAPFVSVIVACYNVEDCVAACVDGLINQDYVSYELVLVDDGSTDATPNLLDGYASIPRVKVIHKENGGLSDARNHGVAASSGEYVVFVDGDDVVSPHFLSALAQHVDSGAATMVVGPFVLATEESKGSIQWSDVFSAKRMNGPEAMRLLCLNEITESAWAKLMPRRLCEEVPFPQGAYYEDLFVIGDRLLLVDEVAVLEEPVYGYVMRSGSITHSTKIRFKRVEDYLDAFKVFEGVVESHFPECRDVLFARQLLTYARVFRLLPQVEDERVLAKEKEEELRSFFRGSFHEIMSCSVISSASKVRYALIGLCPALYGVAMTIWDRVKTVVQGDGKAER